MVSSSSKDSRPNVRLTKYCAPFFLPAEPTSGLDGQSAYNIVRFLRKLAGAGQAIL